MWPFGGDPARKWRRDPALRLDFDLEAGRLAEVGFGDPVESLARFGPPGNPHATRDGVFRYESEGFEIDATRGRIDCFCFFWGAPDRPQDRPFSGRFSFAGRREILGPRTRLHAVTAWLGEPWWRHDDAEETILFYERPGNLEWQVEFHLEGTLKAFTAMTPPLLQDRDQRENCYRVTRPWPPRG